MMVTTLFAGTIAADFDSEITVKFSLCPGTIRDVRDERMQIGIRNEKGEIYRVIGITGLGEFLEMVGHLNAIGLVDELNSATRAQQGFDAIFSA